MAADISVVLYKLFQLSLIVHFRLLLEGYRYEYFLSLTDK